MSEKETNRLEAFSDAVFAVAITLLVLDLKVPRAVDHPSPTALLAALRQDAPSYLAFVTSFATILIVWVNHHGIFSLVDKVNTGFLFANGLTLSLQRNFKQWLLTSQKIQAFPATACFHRSKHLNQNFKFSGHKRLHPTAFLEGLSQPRLPW